MANRAIIKPRQEFLGAITKLAQDGSGVVDGNGAEIHNATMVLNARASQPNVSSDRGSFWVRAGNPTTPKFTNSNGTTVNLGGDGLRYVGFYTIPDSVVMFGVDSWKTIGTPAEDSGPASGNGVAVGPSTPSDVWICHLSLDVTKGTDNIVGLRIAYSIDGDGYVAAPGATTTRSVPAESTIGVDLMVVITGVSAVTSLEFFPQFLGGDTHSINATIPRLTLIVEKA